jgi:hypothetical protein
MKEAIVMKSSRISQTATLDSIPSHKIVKIPLSGTHSIKNHNQDETTDYLLTTTIRRLPHIYIESSVMEKTLAHLKYVDTNLCPF